MNEIREKCFQLEIVGIKPSLLLAGSKLRDELYKFTGHSPLSSRWIEALQVNEYKLEIIGVSAEDFCEVYGKEKIISEEQNQVK